MAAKRKTDLIDDLLRQIEKLPQDQQRELIQRLKSLEKSVKLNPSPDLGFTPETELAQKLWAIRQKIEAAGIPLLSREELDAELKEQRERY